MKDGLKSCCFPYIRSVRWIYNCVILFILFRVADSLKNWSGQDDNTIMNLYATQYEQLEITCDLNNVNYTSNYWRKNGQLVETIYWDASDETSRFLLTNKRHHRFSNRGSLIIDTVRLEDSGQWQCQVFDENQKLIKSKIVNLIVYDVPKNPYFLIDNRILDPNNNFIAVRESTEMTVSCVVDSGNPKPKLEWILKVNQNDSTSKNGYEKSSDLNMTDIVDQNQENGARSDVHFRKILRAHHNATITCLVYHMALKVPLNISFLINVHYVPSFTISRTPGFGIPIIKGMSVSLKCAVDSNPPSEPFWQMNDQEPAVDQNGDGFLNFSSIRMSHKGWYKCLSKHIYGQFASTSYFLNVREQLSVVEQQHERQEQTIEFKKSLEHQADFSEIEAGLAVSKKRQIEVTLGGAVQLQCPQGTIGCWSKVNTETNRLDALGSAQELKLDKIIYQEAGEYRCVEPNKDHRRKLDALKNLYSVEVTVIGQPVIFNRNQSFNVVTRRTSWNISFDFCANPPYERSFWIVGDRILKPGQKLGNFITANFIQKTISQYCHRAILTFAYVTVRNSGQYFFLVRSSRGLAEGFIFVNVTQNQTDPEFMGFSNSAANFRYHKNNSQIVVWLFFAKIVVLFLLLLNDL